MKMWKVLPALVMVVCLCAGSAFGAQRTLIVATDATFPPMEMVDTNKQIVGFDIDLLNAAAKEGGFKVEFKNTAWDGIFAGLPAGQ